MQTAWISTFIVTLIWSGIHPKNYFTWFLEVAPALIGFIAVSATYKKFRLTQLTYTLILLHCIILMIGGHYTYANVPLFDWIRDYLELERNNYDKVAHLAQGFIPAIIIREIFIKKSVINSIPWRNFIIVCFCLALSAFYEIIEWLVAISTGESAEAFLGTQGYVWDTQSDMGLALLGAILSLMILSRLHDKQIHRIKT